MTELYDIKNKIDIEKMKICANGLKCGKLVVFPTETVYGIGANALDKDAVDKIFIAKGRPNDNPLIVHVSDKKMLYDIAQDVSEIESEIIDAFCPGPLTIILKKKDIVPYNTSAGLDTIGIRIPDNEIAKTLINLSGVPVAAPSANISGRPSGTNINDIYMELRDRVDYILDGGNCDIGLESTVIKVVQDTVRILRPGKITANDFLRLGLKVEYDKHIFKEADISDTVESPGMKHRHYAPSTNTMLVYSENEDILVGKIKDILKGYPKKEVCIIGCNEHENIYGDLKYINYGSKLNMLEISTKVFTSLRKIDKENVQICIIEGVKKEGLGIAVMNRLIRACAGKVYEF